MRPLTDLRVGGRKVIYSRSSVGSVLTVTAGLGHGDPQLALQAAYAAGRYGHIMFAGATHEPALNLAERVLKGLENPRLTKIFYTDNGSTATDRKSVV